MRPWWHRLVAVRNSVQTSTGRQQSQFWPKIDEVNETKLRKGKFFRSSGVEVW